MWPPASMRAQADLMLALPFKFSQSEKLAHPLFIAAVAFLPVSSSVSSTTPHNQY